MKTGDIIKVRLFGFKVIRQYGSRSFSPIPHFCMAEYETTQTGGTHIVKLIEPCNGHPKGHRIAIDPKDFNL